VRIVGFFSCLCGVIHLPGRQYVLNLRFWPRSKALNQISKGHTSINFDILGQGSTHGTVGLSQMFKCVSIDTLITTIHHVVVGFGVSEEGIHCGDELQSFIATTGGYDSICRSNSRDNVFDDTLGH
jgi:hypothetical protein